jgi:hypothetical protein
MGIYKFQKNEQVAHIENLSQKMRVREIRWRWKEVSTDLKTEAAGFEKTRKRLIDGIECEWWYKGELNRQRFHSELLVPWVIAEKGKIEAEKFLEDMKINRYGDKKHSV